MNGCETPHWVVDATSAQDAASKALKLVHAVSEGQVLCVCEIDDDEQMLDAIAFRIDVLAVMVEQT